MTSRLEDVLASIQTAEPTPAEWSAMQARLFAKVELAESSGNAPSAARDGLSLVSPSEPARQLASAWWGLGVAAGAVAAGVGLLALSSGPEFLSAAPPGAPSFEPGPPVAEAAFDGVPAASTLDSPPEVMRAPVPAPIVPKSPPKLVHKTTRSEQRPQETSAALEQITPRVKSSRGESDVEHDRRHLAPVDAALRAHEPKRALELLSEFRPRRLTAYAQALEAIALCESGKRSEGRRLGRRVLTKIPNGGLEHRVRFACKTD